MAAANTDKLLKVVGNTGWQIGAGGVADAEVTTIPLVSASGLPTDTALLITIDRVDSGGNQTPSSMERVVGVVSGNNLVNCIRGVEGTAQAHSGGAVVEIVIASPNINKLIEHLLTEHNQDGGHTVLSLEEKSTKPSAPGSGKRKLYFKEDGGLYERDSADTEKKIGGELMHDKLTSSFNTSASGWHDTGLSVTLTPSRVTDLKLTSFLKAQNNSFIRRISYRILRDDSTTLVEGDMTPTLQGTNDPFCILAVDEDVSAESHSYKVQIQGSHGDTVAVLSGSMLLVEEV